MTSACGQCDWKGLTFLLRLHRLGRARAEWDHGFLFDADFELRSTDINCFGALLIQSEGELRSPPDNLEVNFRSFPLE